MKHLCILIVTLIGTLALAHDDHMAAPTMPKDFDKIKALVGQWESTSKEGDKEVKAGVSYELTAGGTAVIEKLFAGTPHEMVSVFHANGNKVAMTHYCMLGNHPEMTLKSATDNTMDFEMAGNAGITSKTEPHMHSLTITVTDPNHITEVWSMYEGGKKKDTKTIALARK